MSIDQDLAKPAKMKQSPYDLQLTLSHNLQSITGGVLHQGEGAPHYQAQFRLLVFRPFPGEVLTGKIAKSDQYVSGALHLR